MHSRQPKSNLVPTPEASEAAQQLLLSFAITNSPESLFRALPTHGTQNMGAYSAAGEDSLVGQESICIPQSKNCWAILKDGFVGRKALVLASPRKGKSRRESRHDTGYHGGGDEEDVPVALVASHVWPVLQFFLDVFEEDEQVTGQSGARQCINFSIAFMPPNSSDNSSIFAPFARPITAWARMGSHYTCRHHPRMLPAKANQPPQIGRTASYAGNLHSNI